MTKLFNMEIASVPLNLKVNIWVNREGPKDEAEVGAWSEVIWQGVVGGGNWGESEEEGHWPRGKGGLGKLDTISLSTETLKIILRASRG